MNYYPINNTTGTNTSNTTNPTTTKKDSGSQTFMTLLVAQLKNQDPLEPQDGAQFVAQLAQFNSLEQLISINDRLNQLLNQSKTATSTNTNGSTNK